MRAIRTLRLVVLAAGMASAVLAVGCWKAGSGGTSGAPSDTDTDTDTDSDSDADTDTDTDTDSDSDCAPEAYQQCGDDGNVHWVDSCDAEGEIADACDAQCSPCTETSATEAECATVADLTGCTVVTVPDFSYDLCIDGVCQSPGCGTAECNVPGPTFPLADTSQRLCYDAADEITCTPFPCDAEGLPELCGQDAQYGWDALHDAAERFTRDTATAPGEPLVLDEVTDLEWQGCAFGYSGDDCSSGSATAAEWSAALIDCEELEWGGYDDWRLPNEHELMSIADYGKSYAPFIDSVAFPVTPSGSGSPDSFFWTSSTRAANPDKAAYVAFGNGNVNTDEKANPYYIRCVRGDVEAMPERFARDTSAAGYPVVIDNATGLEWQGCANGLSGDTCGAGAEVAVPWSEALATCEGLSWAGHADWRLPDLAELHSIADNHVEGPTIDGIAFPGTPSSTFWTSSTRAAYASYAWSVRFDYGNAGNHPKTDSSHVRCVRSGS